MGWEEGREAARRLSRGWSWELCASPRRFCWRSRSPSSPVGWHVSDGDPREVRRGGEHAGPQPGVGIERRTCRPWGSVCRVTPCLSFPSCAVTGPCF